MVSIKENRTIILERNGNYKEYKKETGILHQNNLDEYAKGNQLEYSNVENIISKTGCIIFRNINDTTLLCDLPNELTDEQLYHLEIFSELFLSEVEYMEIKKHNAKEEEFILSNNVAAKFLNDVIQSYYKKETNASCFKNR